MSARSVRELARALGVQTSFTDVRRVRRRAGTEELLAVIRALGEPVERAADASRALERVRAERRSRLLDPVVVAWDGRLPHVEVRSGGRRHGVRVELEDGREHGWTSTPEPLGDGVARLEGGPTLPFGAHRLVVESPRGRADGEAVVLSAPRTLHGAHGEREWGVFVPLHALVTQRGWGAGDLAGLAELADRVRSLGGGIVATLPLLARFPGEASPYSPASRLFWDERYVDVDPSDASLDGLAGDERFRRALEDVRSSELVDHRGVLELKRRAIERLAAAERGAGGAGLRRYLRARPDAEDYARFRAAGERWGLDWRSWPRAARHGRIRPSDVDPGSLAYHRFAQYVAEEQVAELGRRSREAGAGLYLDMPLGVHPDGYDAWRYREDFAPSVSVGAPPDDFFPAGQDWGFPPVHPRSARERGYGYVRACLRHVFRHAGVVRVDHAIGLHRQYWVPHGMASDRGVMVRYPAHEWYAALALEAHRTGTVVVGEDLGTVPREVRAGMRRHGLLRSYVLQYEVAPDGRPAVPEPPRDCLASLNTHDMPTFATFWRGADIPDRVEDGLLPQRDAPREVRRRERARRAILGRLRRDGLLPRSGEPSEREVLAAALSWLGASDARFVVVTLEDLWGETRAVNVPGIVDRPNWRGRAALTLEEIVRSDEVVELLRAVDRARRGMREEDAA